MAEPQTPRPPAGRGGSPGWRVEGAPDRIERFAVAVNGYVAYLDGMRRTGHL